ncbi:hypothetical protein N9043_02000, partial [bacterium]|nr:hypothetical protein [bacterium]
VASIPVYLDIYNRKALIEQMMYNIEALKAGGDSFTLSVAHVDIEIDLTPNEDNEGEMDIIV